MPPQLIEENKTQARRITELEKRMSGGVTISSADTRQVSETTLDVDSSTINNVKLVKLKLRSASKSAAATWFEWYTRTPRLWEGCGVRQYKSQSKQIVNFMKLFLSHGFTLDPSSSGYSGRVMTVGNTAEANTKAFLRGKGMKSKLGSGLLKQLRLLHRNGAPKEVINDYRARLSVGQICGPAPVETKDFA
ncbi:hypothetical protein L915_12319 [Phytophthora nicotianae]|uniref:Uncharacterized protein n=1 Tax=Phytophthora nicotianae TaxID=4792 RepID=W2GJ74_PHYNI|nr:hypothetical protein L915_12319 [Phytophthora nicotianae]